MNDHIKKVLLLLIIGFLSFFTFMLWDKKSKTEEKKAEQNVKVAYGKYVSPIFVGIEKGFFKEQGLDIYMQLIPNTGATTQAMALGEVDVATLPYSVLFSFEKSSPGKFVIFGGTIETKDVPYSFLIVKEGISSPSELEKKKVVIRSGINSRIQAEMVVSALGIDPKKVEFIQVEPPLTVTAFAKEDVSAAIDIEPSTTAMIQKKLGIAMASGIRPLAITDPYPTVAHVFSNKFATENPEGAEKFRLALERTIDFMKENERETREIIKKSLELEDEIATNMNLPEYEKLEQINKEAILRIMEIEVQKGILEEKVDFSHVYYTNKN